MNDTDMWQFLIGLRLVVEIMAGHVRHLSFMTFGVLVVLTAHLVLSYRKFCRIVRIDQRLDMIEGLLGHDPDLPGRRRPPA